MNDLIPSERHDLAHYEAIIERGLATFVEVGAALLEIRGDRLYRETHATFEDYCAERWGFSRFYAYDLMKSSKVVENLRVDHGQQLPANWLDRLARKHRTTIAGVMDRAIAEWAASQGFEEPPPERMP